MACAQKIGSAIKQLGTTHESRGCWREGKAVGVLDLRGVESLQHFIYTLLSNFIATYAISLLSSVPLSICPKVILYDSSTFINVISLDFTCHMRLVRVQG